MNLSAIKRKCAEQGISIYTLEKRAKIGNGMVAKWETGSPRVDSLKKVADYFNCTVDELLREDT